MERQHESKLREFQKTGIAYISKRGEMEDLHVSDFLAESPITEKSAVEEVFIFAMKAEDKASRLYSRLADLELDEQVKKLFTSLACEEKKHKYDLETEYEKMFMREN
jgi:rubrerythrin